MLLPIRDRSQLSPSPQSNKHLSSPATPHQLHNKSTYCCILAFTLKGNQNQKQADSLKLDFTVENTASLEVCHFLSSEHLFQAPFCLSCIEPAPCRAPPMAVTG